KEVLSNDKAQRFLYEFERRDGSTRWLEVTARSYPTTGGERRLILVARDTTERKFAEESLRHQALHDSLTGLPNRLQLTNLLEKMLPTTSSTSGQGLLVYLNLDYFKVVNNTIGHEAGDQVLINIVRLLQTSLRPGEMLARVEGDEFVLAWPDTPHRAAENRCDNILRLLASLKCGGMQDPMMHVSACAGMAPIQPQLSARELLSQASSACYAAKRRGRHHCNWYTRSEDEREAKSDDVRWTNRIEEALSQRTFVLHYQPIVTAKSGKTVFYEALIRWPVEGGGWVSPGTFLPVAERVGIIEKIDEYVMECAAEALREYSQLQLCINLSGKSLQRSDLITVIESVLSPYAHRVIFEITETAIVSQLGQARQLMLALQSHGYRFALDDFGMGYCSLAYLRDLPANILKIDGSFIKELATQAFNRALLRSLTEIARLLGQQTVAEHVETAEQHALINELGIDYAQGYFFGKAQPLESLPLRTTQPLPHPAIPAIR
ncbi:MAG: putative bifunctional diguanylate cyclase/phosphodiesterase, partial [Candidatus Methylacidiphilales bacterium]|nr:EAL domain-containing protein [Candidatus Methylacidiphilales bacterium]